ncbi:MAG: 4Fe-4S binding protein [Chloroflexi bacterium]|nr:4Fe-4S binding protein [Chloroflexota bacterium]
MTPGINDIADFLKKVSDSTPTLRAERCVNHRHQHAGQCTACASACPVSAITLTPIPAIDAGACLACGACVAVCPSDALEGVRSLVEMWRKALETAGSHENTALVCRAIGQGNFDAARIPCAGALPAEFFVALALAGIDRVTLHVADCGECPALGTLAQAHQSISDASDLLTKVERMLSVEWTSETPPPQRPKQAGVTRRGLFSALRNPAALANQHGDDHLEELTTAGIGSRRALLLDALGRVDDIDPAAALQLYEDHWGAVTADASRCIGCQMCAQFCPTEALSATVDDRSGVVTLWFDAARCTACGLCLRVCFKEALHFEPGIPLVDLANSEYRPIWEGLPPVNPLKSPQVFKAPAK